MSEEKESKIVAQIQHGTQSESEILEDAKRQPQGMNAAKTHRQTHVQRDKLVAVACAVLLVEVAIENFKVVHALAGDHTQHVGACRGALPARGHRDKSKLQH